MEYRKHVLVCTNEKPLHCAEKGGLELFQAFKAYVQEKGYTDILVSKTGCTEQHYCGPTVIVYPDGVWYKEVKAGDVQDIVELHCRQGKKVERLVNPSIAVHERGMA